MADDISWLEAILNPSPDENSAEFFPWDLGVFDAHCHPTDTPSSLDSIPHMKARALAIMATRDEDQNVVANFAQKHPLTSPLNPQLLQSEISSHEPQQQPNCKLIPSFGYHPWFSHLIYDDTHHPHPSTQEHYTSILTPPPPLPFLSSLPTPIPLSHILSQTLTHLHKHPYALIGEIGLDRSFRLPDNVPPDSTNELPGRREGRALSPYRVTIPHQRTILKAQLALAAELQRAVSVHGVAAHGLLFETLAETWKGCERRVGSKKKQRARAENDGDGEGDVMPFPPRICLHSYSGPPDTLRRYYHASVPAAIFVSFSVLVNLKEATARKTVDVIRAVPDGCVLVESDLHCAGERMDGLLERMVRVVCRAKGWGLEEGVRRLGNNWGRFVFGEG
ncbi:MAG: hypothetical protein Q9195_007129 [Heterodermia aff. obscurata]